MKIKTQLIHSIIDSIFYKKDTETFSDFLYNIADVYNYNRYTNENLNNIKLKMKEIPDEIFEDIHTLTTVLFTIYNIGLADCCNIEQEDNTKFSYPINYAMKFSKLNMEFYRSCSKAKYDLSQYNLLINLETIRYIMTNYKDIIDKNNLSDNILETINGFLLKLLSTAIDNFNQNEREL